MGEFRSEELNKLFEAVLRLESVEECYDFFTDLCTINELMSMRQRYYVAKLLDEGEIFNEIEAKTGASSATISRVNRCLKYGSNGYRLALDKEKGKKED